MNYELCQNNNNMMFVTLFFGMLSLETGEVLYCNAGHNPPYRVSVGKPAQAIEDAGGMILGVRPHATYTTGRLVLAAGETLYLYSDGAGSPAARPHLVAAFRTGLSARYVEGQNIAFEYSGARGQYERLPELAADLVRHQVSVIFAEGATAALAAKGSSSTIPIVFSSGGDMVKSGLVVSLNRGTKLPSLPRGAVAIRRPGPDGSFGIMRRQASPTSIAAWVAGTEVCADWQR